MCILTVKFVVYKNNLPREYFLVNEFLKTVKKLYIYKQKRHFIKNSRRICKKSRK